MGGQDGSCASVRHRSRRTAAVADGDRRRRGAFIRAKAAIHPQRVRECARSAIRSREAFNLQSTKRRSSGVEPRRRVFSWSGLLAAVARHRRDAGGHVPDADGLCRRRKGRCAPCRWEMAPPSHLNTDTRIRVYEDEGRRRIRILKGEVLIEGASAAAPTFVEVDGKHLEASAATLSCASWTVNQRRFWCRMATSFSQRSNKPHRFHWRRTPAHRCWPEKNKGGSCARSRTGSSGGSSHGVKERSPRQGETLATLWRCMRATATHPSSSPIRNWRSCRSQGLFAVNNPLGFSKCCRQCLWRGSATGRRSHRHRSRSLNF